MPPVRLNYEAPAPGNRHALKERLDLLQVQVQNILGDTWVQWAPGQQLLLHLVCDADTLEEDQVDSWMNAYAVLWDYRKGGLSFRRLEYNRSHSVWTCPWRTVVTLKQELSAPAVMDFVVTPVGECEILGAKCNLLANVRLMWARPDNCRWVHPTSVGY